MTQHSSRFSEPPYLVAIRIDGASRNRGLFEPNAAAITIDSKRMGTTNASFVISMGHYQVLISVPRKSCNVNTVGGQDRLVSCSKSAGCKAKH